MIVNNIVNPVNGGLRTTKMTCEACDGRRSARTAADPSRNRALSEDALAKQIRPTSHRAGRGGAPGLAYVGSGPSAYLSDTGMRRAA